MKTKFLLAAIALLCLPTLVLAEKSDHPKNDTVPIEQKSRFSLDSPIKVGKTDEPAKVHQWIDNYVRSNYPDCQIDETLTYGAHKNYFIRLVTLKDKEGNILKNEKGDTLYIPFDVSEFKKIFRKKHDLAYKQMEKTARKLRNNSGNNLETDKQIGMDYRNPFILNGKTQSEIEKEQQEIIKKDFPNSKEALRMIWLFNQRYIERISLNNGKDEFGEDQFVILNFDITIHMKEYLKSHKVKETKMSELVTQIEKQ